MRSSALRNINVQLGLLLLLCVGLFHAAVTAILFLSEPVPGAPRDLSASIVVAALTALDAASAAERPAIATAFNANLPGFHVALSAPGVAARNKGHPAYFRSRLPVGVEIEAHDDDKQFSGSLHDGQKFVLDAPTRHPGFSRFAIITLGFVAISLFVFALWAALSLTRPLTNFANAAEILRARRRSGAASGDRARRDPQGDAGLQPHAASHRGDGLPTNEDVDVR